MNCNPFLWRDAASSVTQCARLLASSAADVVVMDGGEIHSAGAVYDMQPLAAEYYGVGKLVIHRYRTGASNKYERLSCIQCYLKLLCSFSFNQENRQIDSFSDLTCNARFICDCAQMVQRLTTLWLPSRALTQEQTSHLLAWRARKRATRDMARPPAGMCLLDKWLKKVPFLRLYFLK